MEIPGYYLIDTLGETDAATVHLAIREDAEQEVALKIFSRTLSSGRAFREQLARQARRLQDLDHSNIVSLYGHGRHQGHLYLAMEYVRGHTLAHRRFDLSLAEQLRVLERVAAALHYVSQRGFVHGNITPDNILLRQGDDTPVVMGIGARDVRALQGRGQTRYLSPEQRQGKKANQRSDVYSLGRVLLLLLQGQVPRALARQFEVDPARLAPEWAIFTPVLQKSLSHNPSQRFASCGEFSEALAELSASEIHRAAEAAEQALMGAGPEIVGTSSDHASGGGQSARPVSPMTLQGEWRQQHNQWASSGESAIQGAGPAGASAELSVQPDDRIKSSERTLESGWPSALVWALLAFIMAGIVLLGLQAG